MNIRNLLGLFASFALSACSSTAWVTIPLQKPEASELTIPATTISDVSGNLSAYGKKYQEAAEDLIKNDNKGKHVAFGGALIGLAGGLTESVGTAAFGTALGGGPSVLSSHLKYAVQANNYIRASRAMQCMQSKLLFLPDNNYQQRTAVETTLSASKLSWKDQILAVTTKELDSYQDLITFANLQIDLVNQTLWDLQRDVAFGEVDIQALEDAISKAKEESDTQEDLLANLDKSETPISVAKSNNRAPTTAEVGAFRIARTLVTVSKFNETKAELEKCVATFSRT